MAFLEQKIQKIAESLADYRASLQSSLKDDHSELLNDFDDVLKLLSSTSEDIVQDACFDTFSSSQPSPKSNPDSNRAVQCDDVFASNVIFDNEAITESNFTCIHRPLEIEVSSYQENGDKAIMQEGDEIECDLPIVQVADRFGAANVLYTYSFLETSFTRRLKRTSLEHAFRIFSDPRSHPLEVFRIFRLVPCFRDKEKMYPYFKDLVSSDRGGSLEISALPFYCIGGAGTHYTTKDEQGKPIYPPKMRIPRRILGTLPMTGTTGGLDAVHQQPQNLELCGYGGQWFDCRDVEGYLREKGVDLDGAGLFPIVHGLPPSPESSDQQNDKPTSAQCPDHPHGKLITTHISVKLCSIIADVTISESPQPSSCTFDLESFLMGKSLYR